MTTYNFLSLYEYSETTDKEIEDMNKMILETIINRRRKGDTSPIMILVKQQTCKTCNGSGEVSHYENQAPLGSGMIWNEKIVDSCPDCTANGNCPICNGVWDDDTFDKYLDNISDYKADKFYCPFCNWTPGEER